MSSRRWISVLGLLAMVAGSDPRVASQGAVTIGDFIKVDEVRLTRTVSEFTYQATLTNGGPALAGATATATSVSPATTVVDGSVTFGPVGSGSSVVSTDTFTFQHDRTVPFDWANLVWTVSTTAANVPPVADAGPDQTAALGALVTLTGAGSSDADGDPLTFAWSVVSRPVGSQAAPSNPTAVMPTFTVDLPGTYRFRLTVHDGTVASAPDEVVVSTSNSAPVAHAGPDQTARLGQTVTLDGSASSDADGNPLTFAWSVVNRPVGSTAVPTPATAVGPTVFIDRAGTYVFALVVHDGTVASAQDTVTISTVNTAPVAAAGPDQAATLGQTVTLDGSGSSDADGDPLTFAWSLTVPAGSAAVLNNPSAVMPTFAVDAQGTYVAQLVVHDGTVASAPDTVVVSTTNVAPVAAAGPDQVVVAGAVVLLDGTGSSDADGNPLTFAWSLTVPPGSAAVLTGASSAGPSFVADVPGIYIAQLVVHDGQVSSAPDTVTVSTTNVAPVANAGPDQLGVPLAQVVTLNGSLSSDADGHPLTYAWAFTSKPAGSLAGLSGATTVAPTFTPDLAGDYIVQLQVSDGFVLSAIDTVLIRTNAPPVAVAGPDQTVTVGAVVALDGTGSSDPEAQPLTYQWVLTRPAGSLATLGSATTATPNFTADVAGTYTVGLTVTDSVGATATDSVVVTATSLPVITIEATDATASEAGPDAGTFTITRTGPTGNALTVGYTVGGSATNGTDYAAIAASVVVPAGLSSATITITPLDDATDEGSETVVLTLSADPGYTVGGPGLASVTIADDDGNVVTAGATVPDASEVGPTPGTIRFTRTGDTSASRSLTVSRGGTAVEADYSGTAAGATFLVTIPAGQSSVDVTIAPLRDNLVEGAETVVLTIGPGSGYTVGTPSAATVTIADDPPVVSIITTDPGASEAGAETGTLTFTRSGGDVGSPLIVSYTIGGTATNGSDYALIAGSVTIAAGESFATRTITPLPDNSVETAETVILTIADTSSYKVGESASGTVTIADSPAVVEVAATDPDVSEVGSDPGQFTFTRGGGDLTSALQVFVTRSGTASEGTDYASIGGPTVVVTIPANQASTTLTITPMPDLLLEDNETVVLTINPNSSYTIGPSGNASLTIHDAAAVPIVTLTAVDASASEVGPDPGVFRFARSGSTVSPLTVSYSVGGTAANGTDYTSIVSPVIIPAGQTFADLTITPIVDGLSEGSETVVLTVTDTADYDPGSPASATVTIAGASTECGGDGGVLINGATHCGTISNAGETDSWTFTANAGDRIAVHIGETVDNNDFRPWIRLGSPTGAPLGDISGLDATVIDDVVAPVTGTYLVRVASFDTGFDGTGTYRLTMTHTPGPITVSVGDEGGPLVNGAMHAGEILQGDVDVWTFTANVGERISVHIGQITETDDFRPWIRLWAPNGASLGDTAGVDADVIDDIVAPVTGTYLVLVASFDTGFDGIGTYRLTMTHTPGPITVSPGDQGGPLTNGATHTGEILEGDADVWTFTANAGERISVHIGQITETDDFRPWIRLWAPNGASLGDTAGVDADVIDDIVAPVTGTYMVLVASFDSGFDGIGTYRLTMTHTPGPITVSPGDEGGPLTNGAMHTGEIVRGDVDVWTFTANVGERISVHIGQITETDDFRPWIRLWAPNGASLGDTAGVDADVIDDAVAPVAGTYLVQVASFDSGFDGTGTYRLTMTHTPGPITVSPGDEGGPLTNGEMHTGEILRGDVDVWTFTATAGERIAVHVGQITDPLDFRPWIRLWAPNGASLGDTAGVDADVIDDIVAPVTGTYMVLVASFDSGFDGTGTYRLTMTHTPGPISVSAGDEGGPLTNGALHTGEILEGDVDVWTFTANVGERISIHMGQITDTDDFRPWIRLWAPNGASLGDAAGVDATLIDDAVAPVTGTYLVLVASFDSGFDGIGTYRLTMTHTPGPITVSAGDQGGALANGAVHAGEILEGDLDVWTFTAVAGDRVTLHLGQTSETDDFRPWMRLWAPNGASLGDTAGVDVADLNNVLVPVSGTYLVLVASFDSGFDGIGSYGLTLSGATGSGSAGASATPFDVTALEAEQSPGNSGSHRQDR